jgi:hypothetical protein
VQILYLRCNPLFIKRALVDGESEGATEEVFRQRKLARGGMMLIQMKRIERHPTELKDTDEGGAIARKRGELEGGFFYR